MRVFLADFVVIGNGLAGSAATHWLSELGDVIQIAKAPFVYSNSYAAQGGIAAAIGLGDSPSVHCTDTLAAGAGLCNEDAVTTLTALAPSLIDWLLTLGVPFDRNANGTLSLGLEAAHSQHRILHAGGDASGRHLMESLTRDLPRKQNVISLSPFAVRALAQNREQVVIGAWAQEQDGSGADILCLARRATVLATGGAGHLFAHSTNPTGATGDGLALAYQAGAELRNLEFIQFHPTALAHDRAARFLISEAVRGAGAKLVTSRGQSLMKDYPLRDLEARDVVSRALYETLLSGESVYLDCREVEAFNQRFPTIYAHCRTHDLDPAIHLLPVSPAAHFMMGGVAANLSGKTSVEGLFAIGEVACTGVHGANRLASNSLLECLVMAYCLVDHLRKTTTKKQLDLEPVPNAQAFTVDDPALLTCVQDILWKSAGIVRDETGLTTGLHALATLERDHPRSPAILTAKLIMTSALARKESRGAHFRRDYPVENRNLSGLDTVTSPECKEEIYFLSRCDRPAFIFGT